MVLRPRPSLALWGSPLGARAWYESGRRTLGAAEAERLRRWLRGETRGHETAAGGGRPLSPQRHDAPEVGRARDSG